MRNRAQNVLQPTVDTVGQGPGLHPASQTSLSMGPHAQEALAQGMLQHLVPIQRDTDDTFWEEGGRDEQRRFRNFLLP